MGPPRVHPVTFSSGRIECADLYSSRAFVSCAKRALPNSNLIRLVALSWRRRAALFSRAADLHKPHQSARDQNDSTSQPCPWPLPRKPRICAPCTHKALSGCCRQPRKRRDAGTARARRPVEDIATAHATAQALLTPQKPPLAHLSTCRRTSPSPPSPSTRSSATSASSVRRGVPNRVARRPRRPRDGARRVSATHTQATRPSCCPSASTPTAAVT